MRFDNDSRNLKKHSNLRITSGCFSRLFVLGVFGILVISAISICSTAFGWRINYVDGILKFALLEALFFVFILVILFLPVNKTVSLLAGTFLLNPLLMLFFGVALAGAIIARFIWHHPTSYFSQSMMIAVSFFTGFILLSLPEIVWEKTKIILVKVFGFIGVLAYVAILKNAFDNFTQSGHMIAILLIQLGVLVFLFLSGIKRTVSMIIIFLGVILTLKNTSLLLLLVNVLGLVWFLILPRLYIKFRHSMPLIIMVGAVCFILIGGIIYNQTHTLFSTGNISFRLWIWQQQFQKFLTSPFYGQLFTAKTAIEFGLYKVQNFTDNNLVPAHNDWLDILLQGGIIGFVIFFFAYMKPISGLLRLRKKTNVSPTEKKLIMWFVLLLLDLAIAFIFNPFLANSDIAYIVWSVVAFALVLEYRIKARLRYSI